MKIGQAPRIPQDISLGSYFGGRRPEDGRIDWRWPAARIYNLIRAVTDPYPGAFCVLEDGSRMMIWWGTPEEEREGEETKPPGSVEIEGGGESGSWTYRPGTREWPAGRSPAIF
jgi:methionyl-tRNA formyltransferase